MEIVCPSCTAGYDYPIDKFGDKFEKKVRCPSCKGVFTINRPMPQDLDQLDKTIDLSGTTEKKTVEGVYETGPQPKIQGGVRISIAILEGPNAGKIFACEKASMVVGRVDGDIITLDPRCSQKHAVLEIFGDVVVLKDLGSTNGTMFKGENISEVNISNHEEFVIGASRLMVMAVYEE